MVTVGMNTRSRAGRDQWRVAAAPAQVLANGTNSTSFYPLMTLSNRRIPIRAMHPSLRYNPLVIAAAGAALRIANGRVAFIFVATTGRSGSTALASVFEAVDGIVSFHEPWPAMTDAVPEGEDRARHFKRLFLADKRLIVRRAALGRRCYLETNHQFIKRFADLAAAEFRDKLRVIHLVRDPESVARSFHRIASVPGRSERGRTWLLDPDDADNLLPLGDLLRDDGPLSHDLHRCLWYWYETEARIAAFRARRPGVTWGLLRTEDINDLGRMGALFESFGLAFDRARLESLVGVRHNTKKHYGEGSLGDDEVAAMHAELRAALKERFGEDAVPPTPDQIKP
jgi:hypothetical protein